MSAATESQHCLALLQLCALATDPFRTLWLAQNGHSVLETDALEQVERRAQARLEPEVDAYLQWMIGASAALMRLSCASVIMPPRIFWKRSSLTPETMYCQR